MRKATGAVLLGVLVLLFATSGAQARRQASAREFDGIAAAVAGGPDGDFYCARRGATFVSTVRRRWAVATMRSNCGLGSQTVRFFLTRPQRGGGRWKLAIRRYEQLGTGIGIPCGPRAVPRDIRCG